MKNPGAAPLGIASPFSINNTLPDTSKISDIAENNDNDEEMRTVDNDESEDELVIEETDSGAESLAKESLKGPVLKESPSSSLATDTSGECK